MTPKEVQTLIDLAGKIKTRDVAKYAQVCREIGEIRKEIETNRADQRHSLHSGNDSHTAAKWRHWAAVNTEKLYGEIQEKRDQKGRPPDAQVFIRPKYVRILPRNRNTACWLQSCR